MKDWMENLRRRAADLKRDIIALGYACRDRRLPWFARAFIFFVVARTLSPIDLIPDFIPVLGQLDDIILTPLYLVLAFKMIPAEVLADARCRATESLTANSQGEKIYMLLVLLVWAMVLAGVGRLVWQLFAQNG